MADRLRLTGKHKWELILFETNKRLWQANTRGKIVVSFWPELKMAIVEDTIYALDIL